MACRPKGQRRVPCSFHDANLRGTCPHYRPGHYGLSPAICPNILPGILLSSLRVHPQRPSYGHFLRTVPSHHQSYPF